MSRGPYAAFLLLLVGSGVAHGWFTHRWRPPARYDHIQAALDAVPEVLGEWHATPNPMDPGDLAQAGIRAVHSRVYRHARTGKVVTVLLVAGAPGPIAVHTPDVCFRGLGFDRLSAPEPVQAGGAEFWKMECARPGAADRNRLLVYWAWNGGAGWEAPAHRQARLKYALKPALSKLYFVSEAGAGGAADAVSEFATVFLPAVNQLLSLEK